MPYRRKAMAREFTQETVTVRLEEEILRERGVGVDKDGNIKKETYTEVKAKKVKVHVYSGGDQEDGYHLARTFLDVVNQAKMAGVSQEAAVTTKVPQLFELMSNALEEPAWSTWQEILQEASIDPAQGTLKEWKESYPKFMQKMFPCDSDDPWQLQKDYMNETSFPKSYPISTWFWQLKQINLLLPYLLSKEQMESHSGGAAKTWKELGIWGAMSDEQRLHYIKEKSGYSDKFTGTNRVHEKSLTMGMLETILKDIDLKEKTQRQRQAKQMAGGQRVPQHPGRFSYGAQMARGRGRFYYSNNPRGPYQEYGAYQIIRPIQQRPNRTNEQRNQQNPGNRSPQAYRGFGGAQRMYDYRGGRGGGRGQGFYRAQNFAVEESDDQFYQQPMPSSEQASTPQETNDYAETNDQQQQQFAAEQDDEFGVDELQAALEDEFYDPDAYDAYYAEDRRAAGRRF